VNVQEAADWDRLFTVIPSDFPMQRDRKEYITVRADKEDVGKDDDSARFKLATTFNVRNSDDAK
jgi:hypothetical protein